MRTPVATFLNVSPGLSFVIFNNVSEISFGKPAIVVARELISFAGPLRSVINLSTSFPIPTNIEPIASSPANTAKLAQFMFLTFSPIQAIALPARVFNFSKPLDALSMLVLIEFPIPFQELTIQSFTALTFSPILSKISPNPSKEILIALKESITSLPTVFTDLKKFVNEEKSNFLKLIFDKAEEIPSNIGLTPFKFLNFSQ